jgi:hypothetical protein
MVADARRIPDPAAKRSVISSVVRRAALPLARGTAKWIFEDKP